VRHIPRKIGLAILLLVFCISGCGKRDTSPLYLYCTETFWYVMQDQCVAFNELYGYSIVMVPVRSQLDIQADSVNIDNTAAPAEITLQRAPMPWKSLPKNNAITPESPPSTPENQQSDNPQNTSHNVTEQTVDQPKQPTPSVPLVQHKDKEIDKDIVAEIAALNEKNFGDIFITDSKKQLGKLSELALIANQRPLCYLSLSLLTATGNPRHFTSIKSVLTSNRKLGIIDPAKDGLGEASWVVLSKIVPGGAETIAPEQIRKFDRQYELLDSLENGGIDAAIVWDSTSVASFLLAKYGPEYNSVYAEFLHEAAQSRNTEKIRTVLRAVYEELLSERDFGQRISLAENPDERYVIQVQSVAMSSARVIRLSERFTDYLLSNQGKVIFQKFGFDVQ
jgi:ABC-type molybdate transport system substrate-binding protein